MYPRLLSHPEHRSFFLFGPRGTGKTWWVRHTFPDALYVDLLDSRLYTRLLAEPSRLGELIPRSHEGWIVIDEVQRVPELLNEAHRRIEAEGRRFVLTGSSARKLRQRGVNLLAGRALTCQMHPLTARERGEDFDLDRTLRYGQLPVACTDPAPQAYLDAYVHTYLREEVQQEGLTRNLAAFSRFLEAASFSQGGVLNISEVARECAVERKVVEGWFGVLEDLMLALRLPVFTRRAQRRMVAHPKFYYFDVGVYRALRPAGPLDRPEEIEGAALETLLLQELRASNDALNLGWELFYWRTSTGQEVDFVLYGTRGIKAFEVKRSARVSRTELAGLQAFLDDYPMAEAWLVYGGDREMEVGSVQVIPLAECLRRLPELLGATDQR